MKNPIQYAEDRRHRDHPRPGNALALRSSVNRSFIIEPAADLVHFHSVSYPGRQRSPGSLRRLGIPYVNSHGGLMPQVLERGKAKKLVYSAFVERERFGRRPE
ncbi:MAG: hypothetical protein R2849_05325 [Thermomicrobiales bacterium]